MKKAPFIFLFMALTALAKNPCENLPRAKACPTSGSTLLDDTYPAAAHVISFQAYRQREKPSEVPSQFVLKVLQSYDFSKDSPPVLVPAEKKEYEVLITQLQQQISESKGKIPSSILDKIVHVEAKNYTWQQDYFEAFFNPETGTPVLRHMESYNRVRPEYTQTLAQSGQQCGIANGPLLAEDYGPNGSFGSGEMGGNIEGLPGGLCLVGENLSTKFARQFCEKDENIVQIEVSWLSVGHVDEVVKVLPRKTPGVPAECSFSLMFASPDKALELLAQSKSANHHLFATKDSFTEDELFEYRRSRTDGSTGNKICRLFKDHIYHERPEGKKGRGSEGGAKKAFMKLQELLMPIAHAGSGGKAVKNIQCHPDTITNREFLNAFNAEPDLVEYNRAVQQNMNESKEKILAKVLERLPHCKEHIKVIDVPNLFYGTLKQNGDGTKALPREGNGSSFFPNPTNGVISNNTMIFSDPQNDQFRQYLAAQMSKSGLKSDFIDTWDYSHLGDGNLHCSSHTIPYCSPAKGGEK